MDNTKDDLTMTQAQIKVEELEKELMRLKEAKESNNKEKITEATSEITTKAGEAEVNTIEGQRAVVEATVVEEQGINEKNPRDKTETASRRKAKTNAEAYASSEKYVASMLEEYDAISNEDEPRRRSDRPQRKNDSRQVSKKPVEAHKKKEPAKKPVEAHKKKEPAKKPVEAHKKKEPIKKPVETHKEKELVKKPVEAHKKKESAKKPIEARKKKKHVARPVELHKRKEKGDGNFLSRLTGMDYIIGLTGVLVLIAAVMTVSIYSTVKAHEAQIESFASIGDNMAEIGIAGESALLALANRPEEEVETIDEEIFTLVEYDEKDDESDGNIAVNMKLQTVVKDLKIKFVNKKTGKLVPGVPFQVEITDSAKKTVTKTDDDKDGIIYISSMTPGETKVKMVPLTGYDAYSLLSEAQTINVKETLDYKKIDVSDEVKTEAQVNAAAEDTAKANVTESELKDTVAWVESTKTPIGGENSHDSVSRDKLDSVPDEVKRSVDSASATGVLFIEKFKSLVDMWSINAYAMEETTEPEESTEQNDTNEESKETTSSTQSQESEAENDSSTSQVDWDKPLTYNGKQVYLDSDCTVKATYKDYKEHTEFYYITSEASEYKYTGWQTLDGITYFFDSDGNKVTGDQVIQGARYSFGSDGALKTGSGVLGIDVSKWNGSIDWSQVKNSGISYVIIRCGYRGSTTGALIEDPTFRSNIKGATAAGLKVGIYFFTQATNEVEAVEEASMTLNLISGYRVTYPVFLDVESSGGRGDKIDAGTRTKVINAYCQTIRNSGYSAGVYANKTWLSEKFSPGGIGGAKIWLAQYAATPTYGGTYQMWQYSSKGSVKGIKGNVDMNLSYMNY